MPYQRSRTRRANLWKHNTEQEDDFENEQVAAIVREKNENSNKKTYYEDSTPGISNFDFGDQKN